MSRIVKFLFSLLAIAAIYGVVLRVQGILAKDPFAKFRNQIISNIGIQLKDVAVREYLGNKLMGDAHVDVINVRQDRQYLDFLSIRNGIFHTPRGTLRFSAAATANFDALTRQLNITSGAKVANKDMNLVTSAFLYDEGTSTLTMPGGLHGVFYNGKIEARNLIYRAGLDSEPQLGASRMSEPIYQIQGVNWVGNAPDTLLADIPGALQAKTRTGWHLSGDLSSKQKGVTHFVGFRASDEDVLIKAPEGDHDDKTDVVTATGKVYYFSAKANLVCDKAVIYRKEKRAVLTGHVHMLVKPKDQEQLKEDEIPPFKPPVPQDIAAKRPAAPQSPEDKQQSDLDDELRSSKSTRKYPAHIKADNIEYWYAKGSRHAIITGSPDCYQDLPGDRWRRIVTYKALYDGEKDELTLISTQGQKDTRMKDSIGDDFVATSVVVSTKDDDEDAETYSSVAPEGLYYASEDEAPNTKGGPQGKAPAPSPGAPIGAAQTAGTSPKSQPPSPNTTPTPTTGAGH